MSDQLFVIKDDYGIISFYSDLEKAKNEIKCLFNKKPDFKHYGYYINIYNLENMKYIYSKISYSYEFDKFITHVDKDYTCY
jgi:hypothetical protein